MANLSGKSIPLLISKLKTAIMTSQRARGGVDMWRRREEIKDELTARGTEAITPLLDLLHNPDTAPHAADVIGRIGTPEAVVALAQILADAHPPHAKRAVEKGLILIHTPDALLAVNLWRGRLDRTRGQLRSYIQGTPPTDPLLKQLNLLAEHHRTDPAHIAEAYLLLTSDETLSLDANARLQALRLSPAACAALEQAATEKE